MDYNEYILVLGVSNISMSLWRLVEYKDIVYKITSIAEVYIRDKTKNANFFFKAFKVE